MRSLFGGGTPDWAKPLSRSEYGEFQRIVTAELASVYPGAAWDGQSELLVVHHPDDLRVEIQLARLAGMMAGSELHLWAPMAADFFRAMEGIGQTSDAPDAWVDAADLLRAKVYPLEALKNHDPADFLIKPISDELAALLMLDVAERARFESLKRDDARRWEVSDEELWERAIANIHASVPLIEERLPLEPAGHVRSLHNKHRLAVSHILELESHLESEAPNGVLVAIPHENAFLVHELLDSNASSGADYITSAAAELYLSAANTGLTPVSYWWQAGVWQPLTKVVDGRLEHLMAPEFLELLQALGGSPGLADA